MGLFSKRSKQAAPASSQSGASEPEQESHEAEQDQEQQTARGPWDLADAQSLPAVASTWAPCGCQPLTVCNCGWTLRARDRRRGPW